MRVSENCRDDLVSRSFLIKLIDKGVVPELLLAGKYESAGTMAGFSKVLEMKSVSPCIDAVPVVRCGQCAKAKKFHNPQMGDLILCSEYRVFTDECGFCHKGAKMDGGTEDENP